MSTKTFDAAFADFLSYVNDFLSAHHEKNFPGQAKDDIVRVEMGRRYIRLVKGPSVFGFVDTQTGDILKAAGWKAPAKHARGSIFNEMTWTCVGLYGIAYMVGGGGAGGNRINTEALAVTEKKAAEVKPSLPRAVRRPKPVYVPHTCTGYCERCMST